MTRIGQKHLVACRCVLPQFRNMPDPPLHHFVVFSIVGDDGVFEPKLVQCNNCGILHKVTELTCSELINGRESAQSITSIDDIRTSISEQLGAALDKAGADLATWEAVKFIVDEQRWGDIVVLTSDVVEGLRQGKYVRVLGPSLFKIDTFMRDELARQGEA